jgi:hypothetical protein
MRLRRTRMMVVRITFVRATIATACQRCDARAAVCHETLADGTCSYTR